MEPQTILDEFMGTANRFGKMKYEMFFRGLSRREYEMLAAIHRYMGEHASQEGIYVSHLAKMLRVSSPAVSRMIGGLEEKGYIMRIADREDRRNIYVYLTRKGVDEKLKAEKMMKEFMLRIVDQMGEEDIKLLIRLWNKLADIMEEEWKGESNV